MKNMLQKMLWGMIMLVTLTCTLTAGLVITNHKATPQAQVASVEANEASAPSEKAYAERTAHVVVYYYRKHNGWIQRRLWDRTIGKWVDPIWHNVQRY